ncbi:superfamily II DNA helicase [Anaerobacillus arseniciselenatis]|uniref:Superfamily II DNA helicase n=1 Tax=Anaerobacillus arseniciselenatis TaxID=85682 RepID=A0A1S2LQX3_9BACI|nr:RQC-minor-1 family DNA-binding protein [Anaerobacillus arseniciselenatis]OIJ14912.1 superfamily II DNA helicase [Anaerobacillus arseniciselenatis]
MLRAADEIIAQGGRTLLAKILKGSREKKLLQLGLDNCPVYGYFKSAKLEEVMEKIAWMIDYDFLDIEYSGELPMIVFTERGWQIEADQRTDEFLREWEQWLEQAISNPDMIYLKDRNREMIFLFLEKVSETQDKRYIPYLKAWAEIDYKKVKTKIQEVIKALELNEPIERHSLLRREASMKEMLEGEAPQDLLLKCYQCGERFIFTVGEQQFYQQKGFVHPRRCERYRVK